MTLVAAISIAACIESVGCFNSGPICMVATATDVVSVCPRETPRDQRHCNDTGDQGDAYSKPNKNFSASHLIRTLVPHV